MAKIGNFKQVSGEFRGQIMTLTLQAKSVWITVEAPAADSSVPSHRARVGDVEVGAAWLKRTRDDRPYLSVKLDDPSFTAPIFAQLFEGEDGQYDLIWSRQSRRGND